MASSSQAEPVDKYFALCEAIRRKDKEAARQLILNNAPVNPSATGFFNTPLHWAILKFNDAEIVDMLIERGAKLSRKNKYKMTPFTVAIQSHKQEVIKLLLKKGAHVSEEKLFYKMMRFGNLKIIEIIVKHIIQTNESINLCSLVNLAASWGKVSTLQLLLTYNTNITRKKLPRSVIIDDGPEYKKCLELLLQHGYTINALKRKNFKRVYAAVEKGYATIIEKFLKTRINVNQVNKKTGLTLLHLACLHRNTNIAILLIEHKADISIRVQDPGLKPDECQLDKHSKKMRAIVRRTALFIAVNNADIEMTKLLLSNGASMKDEPDLLYAAVKNKCMEMIECLLEFGADINDVNNYGLTPLHLCIMHASEDKSIECPMVEFLLKKGANANLPATEINITPFHIALMRGYTDIVKILLKYHADITLLFLDKFVPIHIAVIINQIDIVDIFIKFGVDININIQNDNGYTSLHYACLTDNESMVDKLLEHNANINCVDLTGKTPLHLMCLRCGSTKIILKLLSHHADVNVKDHHNDMPFHWLTHTHSWLPNLPLMPSNEFEKVYKIFLELIADINAVDSEGRTPLFIACSTRDLPIVKVLLEHKADVNIPDSSGKMPLHAIAEFSEVEIIEMLLENNAKTDHVDKNGNTVLHIAVESYGVGILQVFDRLSIDINAKNNKGNTALFLATESQYHEMAQKLLEHGADINVMDSNNLTVFDVALDCVMEARANVEEYERENDEQDVDEWDVIEFSKELVEMFHKHVIQLKSAGLYVSSNILNIIDNNVRNDAYDFSGSSEEILEFEKECKNEIQRLKEATIGSTTFYKLLSNDIHYVAKYSRNEEIILALPLEDYDQQFPLYFNTIRRRFSEGKARGKLLEVIETCDFSDIFYGLSYMFIDEILRYLDFKDLKTLISILKPK